MGGGRECRAKFREPLLDLVDGSSRKDQRSSGDIRSLEFLQLPKIRFQKTKCHLCAKGMGPVSIF